MADTAAATGTARRSRLAAAHGLFNLVTGLWPVLHYRSFEAVTGPKADEWLVKCVGGLGAAAGYAQLRAGPSAEGLAAARRIGAGTAATFAAIDLAYGLTGRIGRVYLLDAAVELAWLLAWTAARGPDAAGGERRTR
ncbi:hypothetical protein ACFQ36_20365 [Arthrobacter sp. GCM10027362]|uniref:hypothetical protein n=1 Tax=Arthrobacter sp. GCM10027362 TaxID=3273379 RepID=UPI0036394932